MPKPSSRGDTIIEVLIAMAILALVLITAYAISTQSLRTGTSAGQRNQALGYAQSQIEFIKQAVGTQDNVNLALYTSSTPFCVEPDGSYVAVPAASPPTNPCLNYDSAGARYSVIVTYDVSRQVFTVNINWLAANLTAEESTLALYYKLPGGFPLPPSVTTNFASGVGDRYMTLNGEVNPNGNNVTSCYFLFNTSSDFSEPSTRTINCATPTMPISGNYYQSVTASTGSTLAPSTTYHFKACATNAIATVCGLPLSATTLPENSIPPPTPPPSGGGSDCKIDGMSGWPVPLNTNSGFSVSGNYSHCYGGCSGFGTISGSFGWFGPAADGSDNNVPFSGQPFSSGSSGGWGGIRCYGNNGSTSEVGIYVTGPVVSPTPPPVPPPTVPPPISPPPPYLMFIDCHGSPQTYWEHWSDGAHINTGVIAPPGCPT